MGRKLVAEFRNLPADVLLKMVEADCELAGSKVEVVVRPKVGSFGQQLSSRTLVEGAPQQVMFAIGAVADFDEDCLVSVREEV